MAPRGSQSELQKMALGLVKIEESVGSLGEKIEEYKQDSKENREDIRKRLESIDTKLESYGKCVVTHTEKIASLECSRKDTNRNLIAVALTALGALFSRLLG